MINAVAPVALSEHEVEQFKTKGYVKLSKLLTEDAIEGLRALVTTAPEQKLGSGSGKAVMYGDFAQLNSDVGNKDELVRAIYTSAPFRSLLDQLGQKKWIFTQGLRFELEPGEKKGIGWHFGFQSFNYIKPSDLGFTIWIPLDPIDTESQRGGLAVVSEEVYSGREETKLLANMVHNYESESLGACVRDHLSSFTALRDHTLDTAIVEYSFALGDAILFNRYVFHRTCPLGVGPMKSRRAYVMRFVDATATYDKKLAHDYPLFFSKIMNLPTLHSFGASLSDLEDGDLIAKSASINPAF